MQSFGLILDFLTSDNKGDRYAHAHTRTLICSPLFSLKCDNEILKSIPSIELGLLRPVRMHSETLTFTETLCFLA